MTQTEVPDTAAHHSLAACVQNFALLEPALHRGKIQVVLNVWQHCAMRRLAPEHCVRNTVSHRVCHVAIQTGLPAWSCLQDC